MRKLNPKNLTAALVVALSVALPAAAQEPSGPILFTNVNVFDGVNEALIKNANVVVTDNLITAVSTQPLAVAGGRVIDGGGRTLMPGLIDAHVHLSLNMGFITMYNQLPDYVAARTLAEAQNTLMRGFTSVRDTGGQVLGAKKAIDEGYFAGPRIWASGAGISMTAGHADLRPPTQRPRQLGGPAWTEGEYNGGTVIADGVPEVLSAARLQMRQGAAFLKMFTSGAVSGMYDPLDIGEYSFEEIKAAADEAKRWNTYLAVHTYNDKGARLALEAGAMAIDHGNLMTEETMKLLVKKGAFLNTQTGVFLMAAVCAAQSAAAQEASERSAAEVAALLAHPNSVLGTLNFNLDFTTYDGTLPGAGDQDGFTLGFQPVLPYPLKSDVNLFVRPLIPIVFQQPVPTADGFEDVGTDLGDISFDAAVGKTFASGMVLVGGVVGTTPTATNDALGLDQWLLGPEALVAVVKKWGALGRVDPSHSSWY